MQTYICRKKVIIPLFWKEYEEMEAQEEPP